MRIKTIIVGIGTALLVSACSPAAPTATTPADLGTAEPDLNLTENEATTPTQGVDQVVEPIRINPGHEIATVSGPVSGNRVVAGSSRLIDQIPVDIHLSGEPAWVVGVRGATEPTWVVAHEDGTLEAWRIAPTEPEQVPLNINALPAGTPPVVSADGDEITVVAPPADASPLTFPAAVSGSIVYVRTDGTLVVADSDQTRVLDVDALPDSRISVSSDGLVSVLAGATDRYPHGVLGDRLEASRIVVIDPTTAEVVGEAVVSAPDVVEGIAAPWIDADGDGVEELLVTVSNGEVGARLSVFDRDGEVVAEGPPIGRANRWRNQLGAGPFGPDGEIEIIDIRVPHIGGVVEYFRLDGDELVLHTQQTGFTSHVYGSRNLDMALAVDATGDGRLDVVASTQDLDGLGILTRTGDGIEVVAELSLPGRLTSNISAVSLADGGAMIAVGTSDQVLRVYLAG